MKFLKIALIVSCVLSAVLSRRSHSKGRQPSTAAYQSRIQCEKVDDCKQICINFRIVAKNIACHQALCEKSKCVCAPAAGAKNIVAADKCQYAEAEIPSERPPEAPKNGKRRRRY